MLSRVHWEPLDEGARRISRGRITFTLHRLTPTLLTMAAAGTDNGELTDAPVRALDRELAHFPGDTEVLVDATEVQRIHPRARDLWADWLAARGRSLRMHVLVARPSVDLSVAVARHHARIGDRLRIHRDRLSLGSLLRRHRVTRVEPRSALSAQPVTVSSRRDGDVIVLEDGRCTITIARVGESACVTRIRGVDRGVLTAQVFDRLASLRKAHRPFSLYLDLRDASLPPQRVRALWLAWLTARRRTDDRTLVLVPRNAILLSAGIAHARYPASPAVSVTTDAMRFRRALAAAAR